MFRTLGKSKIAFILAILFGISLFFFKGGSRYSNLFNSDNVAASVSGTPISTTKFMRTLQLNVNKFGQMLGKEISIQEIETFQIHSLALSALINDAVFENEYNKKGFKLDEKIVASKTKEKIPQLYNNDNSLNDSFLNNFLQEQQLKIEDIVQIIDFETRNESFNKTFFDIQYPKIFADKINKYDNHKRIVSLITIPIELIDISKELNIEQNIINDEIEKYFNENSNNYMSQESRDVDYIKIKKDDYGEDFIPTDIEIIEYYNLNKDLYFEKEKRSFMQFNFTNYDDAKEFKNNVNYLSSLDEVIEYAQNNDLQYNNFKDLSYDDIFEEVAEVLFKLNINEQSNIIETSIAKHIIILKDITPGKQMLLKDVKNNISEMLKNVELDSFFNQTIEEVNKTITDGKSLTDIANNFNFKIKEINNLTKNFSDYKDEEQYFYNSLISNVFSSNLDFVSDIVSLDDNNFYFFNVKNIIKSTSLNFNDIKQKVKNDWISFKKIEVIKKEMDNNKLDVGYILKLSNLYNKSVDKIELNINERELPRDLVIKIFDNDKKSNVLTVDNKNIFIALIEDIIIPNQVDIENIALLTEIRSSFGSELLKNVKVSTNDSLINAVINRY